MTLLICYISKYYYKKEVFNNERFDYLTKKRTLTTKEDLSVKKMKLFDHLYCNALMLLVVAYK